MRFGVREIADVTFKALQPVNIGGIEYSKGQPVLYIDTAKTSTMEGAATTVYATGGRGNSRLIAWEGERTLTFTVEDALLSPVSFAVLSGANLFNLAPATAMVHKTVVSSYVKNTSETSFEIDYVVSKNAPIFISQYNNGSVGDIIKNVTIKWLKANNIETTTASEAVSTKFSFGNIVDAKFTQVIVDFYIEKKAGVMELQIDAENFAGYYYVEASTLFRREEDGKDLPATLTFPRVKIQSNFSFAMAATGDPSTFTFTMDAFPAYTLFDKKKKVLCAMQVINPNEQEPKVGEPVTTLDTNESGVIIEKVDKEYLSDSLNNWIIIPGVVEGLNGTISPINERYLMGIVTSPIVTGNYTLEIAELLSQPYLTNFIVGNGPNKVILNLNQTPRLVEITIPTSVTNISITGGSTEFKTINYLGTTTNWEALNKTIPTGVKIICSNGEIK